MMPVHAALALSLVACSGPTTEETAGTDGTSTDGTTEPVTETTDTDTATETTGTTDPEALDRSVLSGTGEFAFDGQASVAASPITVYFHIPEAATRSTPILVGLHGGSRDATNVRDRLIEPADERGFIVVVPLFSSDQYSLGDEYIMGNIFRDGDNPSPGTLNPEDEWTFSVIEPLFEHVAATLGSDAEGFDLFGFSAGAQFTHRLVTFRSPAVNRVWASAAGWYTPLDGATTFPYGLDGSPIEDGREEELLALPMTIAVGTSDNDPEASSLRRNATVDAQGDNRLDRARYYYALGEQRASDEGWDFNWSLVELDGVTHTVQPHIDEMVEALYPTAR